MVDDVRSSSYFGGKVRRATSSSARATYRFTGREVTWITAKGASRGKARVYIDGVLVSTVDLRTPSTHYRRVVFRKAWSASGAHTITIRPVGNGRRGRRRVRGPAVTKGRLEAFSDGVLAIIITIMVLELRPPEETTLEALQPIIPAFLSYVLSFAIVGIYWNNHHHLFQAVRVVDGRVLWANLLLLFVLSLLPFGSAWMGEHEFAPVPVALYGVILLLAAIAFFVLVHALLRIQPDDAPLAAAIGSDTKGKLSPVVYLVSIPIALVAPLVAFGLFVAVALVWIVPDTRIERTLSH